MTEDQRKITDLVNAMNEINKGGDGNPTVYYDGDYVVLTWFTEVGSKQSTRHDKYTDFLKYVISEIADGLAEQKAKQMAFEIVKAVMSAIGIGVLTEEDFAGVLKKEGLCH